MCETQKERPDNLIIIDTAVGLFYTFQIPKSSNDFHMILDSFSKQSIKPELYCEIEDEESSSCFMRKVTNFEEFLTSSEEFNPQGVLLFMKSSPLPLPSNPKPWRCRTCGRRDISSSTTACPLCGSSRIS